MLEKHFRFHAQPFAEHTPAERLWPDERLTQGLARLRYLTAAGTLGLITGASGVGKSALLKRVWHAPARPRRPGPLPALGATLQQRPAAAAGPHPRRGRPSGAKTNSWGRSASAPSKPKAPWSCSWTKRTCCKPPR